MPTVKQLLMSVTAFWAATLYCNAAPAIPAPVPVLQPDGTYIDVILTGDEHGHSILSADGTRLLVRDSKDMLVDAGKAPARIARKNSGKLAPPMRIAGSSGYPSVGKQRALAILVQFPATDEHPEGRPFSTENPRQLFDDMLNKPGYNHNGATGSVRDYYLDSSSGLFDLTFDVYGPVTLSRDLTFYSTKINGEDLNAWNMAEEACRILDAEINFKDYDRDGDGVIDNVYIFYAGPGAATGGDPSTSVWQHAADIEKITGKQFVFDGVRLNHYACSNEYRDVRGTDGTVERHTEGIGTVCHEFSHVLGLPDIYDTTGMNTTCGDWSVMDTGCHLNNSRTPPRMSAYERSMLGWIEPRRIGEAPESVVLREITHNEACMIATGNTDEYFLLENRRQTGWDSYLPGHGMLIWHIHYMPDMWALNQVNTLRGDLGVDILRADGDANYETRNGDTFPGAKGVTSISDDGYPNMRTNAGESTNAPLSAITESGGVIFFDVCKENFRLAKVTGLTATEVTPSGFTLTWDPVSGTAVAYKLYVYEDDNGLRKLVNGYSGLIIDDVTATVQGLKPSSEYIVSVTAFSGNTSGEPSDELTVNTPELSFRYEIPVAEPAELVDASSFRARWQPVDGATDYALSVYTKTKGEADICTVDFTGGIEAIPAGWTTNCCFTMSIDGYYGETSPSLSMTDDYARLQSPLLKGYLRSISFWYRERSASGKSSIEVSALDDTNNWIPLVTLPLKKGLTEGERFSLGESSPEFPAGCRAVRFVYRRVDSGSLALDDIVIGYNDKYTYHTVGNWSDAKLGSAETSATVDGLDPGTVYNYTVRAVNAAGEMTLPSNEVKVCTATTGIDGILRGMPEAHISADGTLTVNGYDGEIRVFDIFGCRITGSVLPAHGVYIVCAGAKIFKIIY